MSGQNDNVDGANNNNIPIRTIHVAPINADMYDQLQSYFQQFGEVNSIEIEQVDNATSTHFGLVEFRLIETAATVLASNEVHRIGECDVHVKEADPWHQPDHILNALDDHCLRTILSNLKQLDLANAADVCIRFNNEAKGVFLSGDKKLDLKLRSREEAQILMKTFGPIASSVHVEHPYDEHEILSMIAQYCTPVVKELVLSDFLFQFNLPDDMKLGKVEKLSVYRCCIESKVNPLVSACTNLKALCIKQSWYDPNSFNWPEFNQLRGLRLDGFPSVFDRLLNDIIAKNRALTKLTLLGLMDPNEVSHSRIIREIVQNLPNLVEFGFYLPTAFIDDDFDMAIRCVGDLAHLKVLKINLNERSAAPLSAALVQSAIPIEHLQLIRGTFNEEAVENISRMKQLKALDLFDMSYFTDERMIKLAKDLGPQLEKLEFRGYTGEELTMIGLKKMLPFARKLSVLTLKSTKIAVDVDDYKAMLTTLQKRPEKIQLSFKFFSGGNKVNVPKTIQAENRHKFYIDEKQCVVSSMNTIYNKLIADGTNKI